MENSRSSASTDDPLGLAVDRCLGRHVGAGQPVVAGLSGGQDSVALLHALSRRGVAISALHIHHGLSPNADDWADFCRDLCTSWNVPLVVERVRVERGSADGLEGAARRARHEVFSRAPAEWVALAHHRRDQAETLLFNLLRGTGVAGAAAMSERNGRLLRPFLEVGREDIAAYAEAHRLPWVEDESNADLGYSRNFIRHRILAELRDRFPGGEANLSAAARRFGETRMLMDELAHLDLGDRPHDFPVDIDLLESLSEPRARNLMRYLLSRRGVGIPGEDRLGEAVRQFVSAGPDRHPSLVFGGYRLFRRKRAVMLESCKNSPSCCPTR